MFAKFRLYLVLIPLLSVFGDAHTAYVCDRGDAPSGYGEARHKVPDAASVYLGATGPDDESPTHYSGDAAGDDTNGSDDEDAFTALPDVLTNEASYSLTVPCVGEGTVAGWIDFDHSGNFTNASPDNERAAAACSGGSATLSWNTASGNLPGNLTGGTTFARLRIGPEGGICQGKGLFGSESVKVTGGGSRITGFPGCSDGPSDPDSTAQVGSDGDVTLSGGATVDGDVDAVGTVNDPSSVTGVVTTGVAPSNLPPVADCSPYSDGTGISATGGLTHNISTGEIKVSGTNTLTLAPGTYCFGKFTLSGGSILEIIGPTTIHLNDKGTLSGGSIANTTLDPDNLRIFSASELVLSGGSQAYVSIYAPSTNKLTISGGGTVVGCAVGGNVELSGGSQFHQDFGLGSGVENPTGTTGYGEVEDYSVNICAGLNGDVSEAAPAVPLQVSSGDKVFVASSSPSPTEGHLKAYTVNADGSVSTSVVWDAATLMNATKRQNGLYSADAAGAVTLFNSLDDAAFASAGTPTVADIKNYTIDPSYNSGVYLAGRKSGSFLGTIGRGNNLALITQMINMPLYLEDANYRSFFSGTVSSRPELVLVGSDDGFVYAFNETDGELKWGWIPRSLVKELQYYSSFPHSHFERGKLDVIDAKDGSGNYATYVVGAYKNGIGHYAIKLNAAGGLADVVWDEDRSASFVTSPNNGEMSYFRDGSGQTYVAYVVTTNAGLSTLVLRNIADASTMTEIALNFNATSTPFIMPDFEDADGPAAKTVYLGDSNGNIRRAALLDGGGALSVAGTLEDASYPGDLGAAEPILFLGASVSLSDRQYYMRAQSENRLTVLQYDPATTNWIKRWTSYVGGAGSWDASATYTADTSGPPSDNDGDGFATNVTANGIQSLPTGAMIADAAHIVADSIVLPVSVTENGDCYGKAYYYFYRLTDGAFPDNTFYRVNGVVYEENLILGYGEPTRVTIVDMPSKEQMRGYGGADQAPDLTTNVTQSFRINDSTSTGMRGWKELGRD